MYPFQPMFLRILSFLRLCYFRIGPWRPSWKVYFYLILKQLNARIILTQIWSKSIQRFFETLCSCSALFLGMPNCIKSKLLHTRNILAQSWINFKQWFLRYRHFRVYAIFSNGPWRPSWIVNLHKFEMVPFKKSKQLIQETFWHKVWSISTNGSWDIVIFVVMLTV